MRSAGVIACPCAFWRRGASVEARENLRFFAVSVGSGSCLVPQTCNVKMSKMKNLLKMKNRILNLSAMGLAALLLAGPGMADVVPVSTQLTFGNDAVSRAHTDTFSNISTVTDTVLTEDGTITKWEVYIGEKGDNAQVGLLLLDRNANGSYVIDEMDLRTVTSTGKLTFTSSVTAESGQYLGFYMSTAKVSFDIVGTGTAPHYQDDNNAGNPTIGATVPNAQPGSPDRVYSINATLTPVPVPASLPMLVMGVSGLWVLRRRAQA